MSDPWLPIEPAGPTLTGGHPTAVAHSPAYDPYAPPNVPAGPPRARRRRAGLVVLAVAAVVVVVAGGVLLAVQVGGAISRGVAAGSAGGVVKIDGPSGDRFSIRLPPGFRDGGDSDLHGGYLGAVSDRHDTVYLDIYTSRRTQSQSGDVDAVAQRVQADNSDHGAKTVLDVRDVTVSGSTVAQWQESYPADRDAPGYNQLTAVTLIGDNGEYLEIDYSDDPGTFDRADASLAVAAVVSSLRTIR